MPTTQKQPRKSRAARKAATLPRAPITSFNFGGAVTSNSKDLEIQSTEFVDFNPTTDAHVYNHIFEDKQQYFQTGVVAGDDAAVAKVRKVEVWSLPRAVNGKIAESSYSALYMTPAYTVGGSSGTVRQVAQRNTLVIPTFNVDWVKVGVTDFNKTFDSSILEPARVEVGAKTGAILFSLALVDPDSSANFGSAVQLMIRTTYALTMPVATMVSTAAVYTTAFGQVDIQPPPAFKNEYSMNKLLRITDEV